MLKFGVLLLVSLLPLLAVAQEAVTVTVPAETAGINGFRVNWDKPFPGSLAFDAVHRSLLVRFPGAAEKIAEQVNKHYAIAKVELVLPFKETELYTNQPGINQYNQRLSFGCDELYKKVQPQWHAVAWPLRQPWSADTNLGPTYNASINGAGYWGKFGAQDEKTDRFPHQFGPTEVSYLKPEGRMDLSALLADAGYGHTLAERLRRLSDCGLMLKKWEVYDFRFRKSGDGAYEWGVATGGRGIVLNAPSLVITFQPAPNVPAIGALNTATDIPALAKTLREKKTGGAPTATMPSPEELAKLIDRYAIRQPAWMPAWQWARVQELDKLGGGYRMPADPAKFAKWIDEILADPPRYWNGWDVPDRLLTWYLYKDALPVPVQEHIKNYWSAWIMPDRPTSELTHAQAVEIYWHGKNKYYDETGDWRGNSTFFRDGYCYQMSTMNFNHTAAMGALLGGNIVGSAWAMEDGRHGLEYWPLRTWCWYDGSTQESVDHYYFGLTLSDQKMFADFGPTHLDRMMGQIMLAKSVEELTSAYHPALKRFIASSTRTSTPEYLLATQDGLQHIVHTLSHSGALHDLGNPNVPAKAPVIGQDTPPGRIAEQSATGPWAPEWVANMVDEKPIPYEMTNTYTMWGGHRANPLWRRTYLGKHYGLASTDVYDSVVPILGQWRREDKPVQNVQELGTMVMRYGVNTTPLVNATFGWMHPLGCQAALQHKNKLVVITSPYNNGSVKELAKDGLRSLQSTIAFFNYQSPLTWEIYVDGQKVTALPFTCKQGQRITIKDGVTYIGIIPLPATDLGRSAEVTLSVGTPQKWNGDWQAALVIDSYNLKSDTPVANPDWTAYDRAYGGFVYEFGDVTEYRDFAAFQRHLQESTLTTNWEADKLAYHVVYTSGKDVIEVGAKTNYESGSTTNLFTERKVNGAWPYLPKGIERDTTLTQQGTTGKLLKNGATLTTEPGRMAYLQTEPISDTYAGFNALPDPSFFRLEAPGGVVVTADGRLGLARIIVCPKDGRIQLDHEIKADQTGSDIATALVVFGLKSKPVVERNGSVRTDSVAATVEGKSAWLIPLTDGLAPAVLQAVPARFTHAQAVFTMDNRPDTSQTMLKDWKLVGPFDNANGNGFDAVYGPEKDVTLAAYPGLGGKAVSWQRVKSAAPLGAGSINPLNRFGVNENACAYALTKIVSDRERNVTLFTGSDDTITVWVNGKKVLAKNLSRAAVPDSDHADITLKKGENILLVKVCQNGGGWEFYLRLGDEFGLPVSGLTYGVGE